LHNAPTAALSLESSKSFTGTKLVSISSMLKAACTNTIVLHFVSATHIEIRFSCQIQNDRIFVKSLIFDSPDVLIHYPMSHKCKYLEGI